MSNFTLASSHQNREISEDTSYDDNTDTDGDYSPTGTKPKKSRLFTVKHAPQAVVHWYMISLDKKIARKNSTVKEDALGHLLSMGWSIFYTQKKARQELRYKSPNGRVYISLRTACKACMDQGGAAGADHSRTVSKDSKPGKETSPPLKKPKDNLECVKSVQNCCNNKTPPWVTSRRNPRTALSYLISQGVISPGDRVYYDVSGKNYPLMAWGSVTNGGVVKCDCCSNVFTISHFEAHIGSTKHRPAANIFLEDGRSLLDCQRQLNQNQIQNETKTTEKKANNNNHAHSDTRCLDKNDCICSVCHFGGELMLCDLCPAAFHASCLGFEGIPPGDWFCSSCCCKICGQAAYDFGSVCSSDSSFVKCLQCEQNVHIGCVKSVRVLGDDSNQIDRETWFCTRKCEDIHMALQKLLWKQIQVGEEEDNLTWTLMKHCPDTMTENQRKKFNSAIGIMHESFRPVKDPITKSDLIEDVILSKRSETKRLNFEGFYTVVLERKNKVTTVATLRVYGDEVAEIPFVATRLKYRRHGMCRTMMNELEQRLVKMGVKRVTLPAAPEALNTWTGGFGFSKMTDSDRLELMKYTLLGFQHTVRCQKYFFKKIRIPNNLEWGPRKRLKQTGLEYDMSNVSIIGART
ncbi:increased DNA methylation 1-like [Cucurbita pepo subsp. pepo]|uniref:increased DNA methylation 1-like n=1 Tax=Cucurbita pepo subsp. pepo TaxID=3664 RepID=UPI000C9DA3EB|nr:increased DNA methylation 1-like [Cucurbita pepo subsp. pepo]